VDVANAGDIVTAWVRSYYWATPHARLLAQRATCSPGSSNVVMQAQLGAPQLTYLWQHRINGAAVLPGAAYFMAATAAADILFSSQASTIGSSGSGSGTGMALALHGLSIPAPLLLPDIATAGVVPLLELVINAAEGSLLARSPLVGGGGRATVHVTSMLSLVALPASHISNTGTSYGLPSKLVSLLRGALWDTVVASAAAQRPAHAQIADSMHGDGCGVDVGAFDAWLQLGQLFRPPENLTSVSAAAQGGSASAAHHVLVPASAEVLLLPLHSEGRATRTNEPLVGCAMPWPTTVAGASGARRGASSDFWLSSGLAVQGDAPAGLPVCTILRLTAKPMSVMPTPSARVNTVPLSSLADEPTDIVYAVEWQALSTEGSRDNARKRLDNVLHPQGVPAALATMQGLLISHASPGLVLRGAVMTADIAGIHDPCMAGAAREAGVAAMMRCIALERPTLALSVHAVSPYQCAASCGSPEVLLSMPVAGADVYGCFQHGEAFFQPRLLPVPAIQPVIGFQMLPGARDSIDSLVPRSTHLPKLEHGQVSARVMAVGINFRDVLNVLGMYPGIIILVTLLVIPLVTLLTCLPTCLTG
jgi:Polyketide synthase dehydratase